MSITKKTYGKTADGTEVSIFTLKNSKGSSAEITNYGGIIGSLFVPDRDGKLEDVVLGFDSLEEYFTNGPFFGAVIGRNSNRTEKARFELNGIEYRLNKNDGNNHLHGGIIGFHKVVWDAEIIKSEVGESLQLSYLSKDGEEGYPGNLQVKVTYTFTDDNALEIDYYAVSDKDTVVNLTNHSYFNLSGHNSGSISGHKIMINSDKFTPIDEEFLTTGEIRNVEGTPMDFTKLTAVGERIDSNDEQLINGMGYDHNWILNVSGKTPEKAAEVVDEKSGRIMGVYTTKPGVQFYTGNFLDNVSGKKGAVYNKRDGLCLETQYFPNSMKHKNFPSTVLKAGEKYHYITIYKFLTK